jgi:hypothetical protein
MKPCWDFQIISVAGLYLVWAVLFVIFVLRIKE